MKVCIEGGKRECKMLVKFVMHALLPSSSEHHFSVVAVDVRNDAFRAN